MGISRSEQETYISFMAEGKEAVIYSSDPFWIRKLRKLCEENPANYQERRVDRLGGEEISVTVICSDKGLINLRGKRMKLSEEERAKRAEQLRALREGRS